jgi:hypothetical protein
MRQISAGQSGEVWGIELLAEVHVLDSTTRSFTLVPGLRLIRSDWFFLKASTRQEAMRRGRHDEEVRGWPVNES